MEGGTAVVACCVCMYTHAMAVDRAGARTWPDEQG